MAKTKTETIRKYKDSEILKRMMHYAAPYKWYFVAAVIMTILLVISNLIPTYLLGELSDIFDSDSSDSEKVKIIAICLAFYVFVIIANGFLSYFNSMTLQKAGQKILYSIRNEVFEHIENLSIAQINAQPVGKLVTRVTSDTNVLNELFSRVFINLFKNILTIIFVLIMLIVISPRLTLYVAIIMPILLVASFAFRSQARKAYRNVRTNVSNVNSFLSENISGMKITQIFNQEDKKMNEFKKKNLDLKKSSMREILVFGIFRPFIYILYVTCQIIVIYFGGGLVIDGVVSVGNFVKFYGYVGDFFTPVQQIADQFNKLQSSLASSEKIFDMLDTKCQIQNDENSLEMDHFEGKIEFKNVWFAYNDENWILKDVSFVIQPRQTCAFVGATGAGKTTILALIVRNYEIQKGQILIDDIDVKNIKLECLRKCIGQMLQDVFLFSGSIASNITLREDKFTQEEIEEACRFVNADSFIEHLPDKYEHIVRERGNNFSSGQRQLLSFARTIIHKPNIMILDEATANIDTETEVLIQKSLTNMMSVGTMLIVAHRLSTIQHADLIIVLHHGQIKEQGTHQELLKQKGFYYHLYELQYKHLEE